MIDTSLVVVCGTAFIAVFLLLSVLAIIIRLVTLVFPAEDTDDAALVAAVNAAIARTYSGCHVVRLEEER